MSDPLSKAQERVIKAAVERVEAMPSDTVEYFLETLLSEMAPDDRPGALLVRAVSALLAEREKGKKPEKHEWDDGDDKLRFRKCVKCGAHYLKVSRCGLDDAWDCKAKPKKGGRS